MPIFTLDVQLHTCVLVCWCAGVLVCWCAGVLWCCVLCNQDCLSRVEAVGDVGWTQGGAEAD
jgi:hypothetical protein